MGVRGELFSTKVALQNRTYFFNVKENRLGDLYLNIVESKNRDEGGFDRQSVILFAEDLQEFLQGFEDALRVLEKAAREKRRGPKPVTRDDGPTPRRNPRSRDERFEPSSPPRQSSQTREKRFEPASQSRRPYRPREEKFESSFSSRRPGRRSRNEETQSRRPENERDFKPRKKRVVVKKR
jgi:hypothetical protein